MDPLYTSLILLLIAAVLIVLELFVPSGGLIGVLAGISILAGIIVAFTGGISQGVSVLLGTAIALPVLLVVMFRVWPHTAIGRRILIQPERLGSLQDSGEDETLKALVGQQGKAKSKMLPSGSVVIGGRVHDAVSDGLPIEAGQLIEVVSIRMNRLIVRPFEPSTNTDQGGDDLLSRSIDSLGIESLDDPLA